MSSQSLTTLKDELSSLDVPGRLSRPHADEFLEKHSLGDLFS